MIFAGKGHFLEKTRGGGSREPVWAPFGGLRVKFPNYGSLTAIGEYLEEFQKIFDFVKLYTLISL